MATEITIPYSPRSQFEAFHESKKRWSVLVCHRRMGKTVACVNHLVRDCLRDSGTYAYIGPTYKQTERIAWRYIKHFTQAIPKMKLNESKLMVEFPTGSVMYLLGSETPDSIRGIGLKGVINDEYQLHPPELFKEVVAPCLADHSGYSVFAGTIRGKNQLYRMYENRKDDPDWFSMWVKASQSGILPQSELDEQRKIMGEEEYMQEFELDPMAVIKGAVFGTEMRWLRENGHVCEVPQDPYAPIDTYWDLGMADYMAILFVQTVGLEERVIDTLQTNNTSLSELAKTLQDKRYRYGTHYLPHDAKQRSLETGKTTEEFLRTVLQGGVEVIERPRRKEDALQAFKIHHKKLWIDKKCEGFLDAMEQFQYEYDDKTQVFKPLPKHNWASHYADAATYWALRQNRIYLPTSTGYNNQDFNIPDETGMLI